MSVSALFVRALVEGVERAGVSREALFEDTGIDGERLVQVENRADMQAFAKTEARALDLTRDEALGLHIAEQATEASFDILPHLVAHAPTLREGLSMCLQFQRLAIDEAHLAMRETPTLATLEFQFARTTERADRMLAEFIVAEFARLLRTIAGPSAVVRAAPFEHPRPAHHRGSTRVFGGVERFGQPS